MVHAPAVRAGGHGARRRWHPPWSRHVEIEKACRVAPENLLLVGGRKRQRIDDVDVLLGIDRHRAIIGAEHDPVATNSAVMRHPGRRFPGILIQGDTLYSMCFAADVACKAARGALSEGEYTGLNELRNHLWACLIHYKTVLTEHGIELPFNEIPGP